MEAFSAYLPRDRWHALAAGEALPERSYGGALFADISGFTSLTAALTKTLGQRRGAEELPQHLNKVYDALTSQVRAFGGSVIGFSGDAMSCWFAGDNGLCATACALSLQAAMEPFTNIALYNGERVSLALKVAVTNGPVRRFVVGDPKIQLMDVLAGELLTRLATTESQARQGEVLLDEQTAIGLQRTVKIAEWRVVNDGRRFAVVNGINSFRVAELATPSLGCSSRADNVELRPWLLAAVYERLQAGQGEFLTELRPVAALFLRFTGIDYDGDEAAGEKLDVFVRWVQAEASRLGGTLIQLTLGDKGSYLYLAFGAPLSHEDDARRAAAAALRLRAPPLELSFITGIQIGLSQGTMRAGAYGSMTRRTYGALGDETNVAARLMGKAEPGQVIASETIYRATSHNFSWRALAAITLKGKEEAITVFELMGAKLERPLHQATYTSPMVGREAELAFITGKLELARRGQGQIVGLTAEAGMGKSRLITEAVHAAKAVDAYCLGGACESFDSNTPYLVWRNIYQHYFRLDLESRSKDQVSLVERELKRIDPGLVPRLPLLGPVLNLVIPDNDLTESLDAELRKSSREALLVDLLRARAQEAGSEGSVFLLALEDLHWIDALSQDLLEAVSRVIANLPVLILLSHRPFDVAHPAGRHLPTLAHLSELELRAFTPEEVERLIEGKLTQLWGAEEGKERLAPELLHQLRERAEGNPFYLEELLNFLHDQGLDPRNPALASLEWPANLHSLILSRIDRLTEAQKTTLKVASIIGRVFRVAWLHGYYPALGEADLKAELEVLRHLDLTPLDTTEPLAYLFKHILTRDVTYESLPYSLRAALHEKLARFIEAELASEAELFLDLLAFHYERSENLAKKREYLKRAGEAAQASFANEAAISYYGRLLPLLEPGEKMNVLLELGEVKMLLGHYGEAGLSYQQALALAEGAADEHVGARCRRLMGELLEKQGDYAEALTWLEGAQAACKKLGDRNELVQVLLAMGGNVYWQQGAYKVAKVRLAEALTLSRELGELRSMARALHGLGNIDLYQGNRAAARKLFEESLTLRRDIGDKLGVANALNNLGIIAANEGAAETARKLFEESLTMRRDIGDKSGVAVALNNLGFMASAQGDVRVAHDLYEESLALRRDLGDKLGTAVALNNLGNLAHAQGDNALAGRLYRESLIITHNIGNHREAAAALTGMAAAIQAVSETQAGSAGHERAVRLAAAADALLATIGAVMEPELRSLHEVILAAARIKLDEACLADTWNEGKAMTLENVVTYALAEELIKEPPARNI